MHRLTRHQPSMTGSSFKELYKGDFEDTNKPKYPQSVLVDLLDAGEINLEQFERLRRESVAQTIPLPNPSHLD